MVKTFSTIPMTVIIQDSRFCGKIDVNDNPLTLWADSLETLNKKMKDLVYEFEGIHVDGFICCFEDSTLHT